MLSYRHAYHAGNFADVFKHTALTLLVGALLHKDKPFFYLDTHAGAGIYDLNSAIPRKNREYEGGVARLWRSENVPEPLRDYMRALRSFNPDGLMNVYPGSPRLVRSFLRPLDRMILCDLHNTDLAVLRAEFEGDRQVTVQQQDAYQALKALLPPKERRGLVLIDPAFELKDERARLLEGLKAAWQRWPTGIYAVWYPIQDRPTVEWFHRQLKRAGIEKILYAELRIFDEERPLRMNGTGMVVINPPWHFAEQIETAGTWLWPVLSPQGEGGFHLEWLVAENSVGA